MQKKSANTLGYNEPKKMGENKSGHPFTEKPTDLFDFT